MNKKRNEMTVRIPACYHPLYARILCTDTPPNHFCTYFAQLPTSKYRYFFPAAVHYHLLYASVIIRRQCRDISLSKVKHGVQIQIIGGCCNSHDCNDLAVSNQTQNRQKKSLPQRICLLSHRHNKRFIILPMTRKCMCIVSCSKA